VERFILTLRCPDRPGIVHAVTGGLLEVGGNILESAQFGDAGTGTFTLRTRFEADTALEAVAQAIARRLAGFGAAVSVRHQDDHHRAMILVSHLDHCLVDLLDRRRRGELPVELPVVASNHDDLRHVVEREGIPFVHLPVTPDTKPDQERRLVALMEEHRVDLVVLARYMQILSADLCGHLEGRVINIHHSFLPGFKGARPYHQAHERGVKLVGATAHYVTAELDEGPIIEQDVVRVDHSLSPEELTAIGRDVERLVLARAVRLHAEDRVVLLGHKTVVFR
jgi:formyltetrahydrofolate deformylase